MSEIYKCEACGMAGELEDLHHEEIDGVLTCLECNGGGQLSTQAEIDAHEQMVESLKPKYDFVNIDLGDI